MTQVYPLEGSGELTDAQLVDTYKTLNDTIKNMSSARDRIAAEIIDRAAYREATALFSDTLVAKIENGNPTYDTTTLRRLLDLELPEAQLAKAYSPGYEETVQVPEKWHGGALNTLERQVGGAVGDIIREARIPGPKRVRVELQ